jgi:hypothetical protein
MEQALALACAWLLRGNPAAQHPMADLLEEYGLLAEAAQVRSARRSVWLVVFADAESFDGADMAAYSGENAAIQAAARKALELSQINERVEAVEWAAVARAIREGRWQDAVDEYNTAANLNHGGASVRILEAVIDPEGARPGVS